MLRERFDYIRHRVTNNVGGVIMMQGLGDFDNVEVGSANMSYGPGTVLQNGALVTQAPPASFGQVRDASGNYLLNSGLRSSPLQAQVGLRFQF